MESDACIWEIEASTDFMKEFLCTEIVFVNDDFADDLFVLEKNFSHANADFIFLRRYRQIQNLIFRMSIFCLYNPRVSLQERIFIVNSNCHSVCHQVWSQCFERSTFSPFVVFVCDGNFEIVVVLTSVIRESDLVGFISNGESYERTKHHNWAVHVVVHNVFQSGFESFFID